MKPAGMGAQETPQVWLSRTIESLGNEAETTRAVVLGSLIATQLDCVRVFERSDEILPRKVVELRVDHILPPIEKHPITRLSVFKRLRAVLQSFQAVARSSEPRFALDFTVNRADGSLSLGLDTFPALVGEDLSRLPTTRSAAALGHEFAVPADGTYLTAAEVADRLGVSKSTVTRRIAHHQMIGFRAFKNALRIPLDQFCDGDVIPGVADILRLFAPEPTSHDSAPDHKAAWFFLASVLYSGEPDPRPIDRLRSAARSGDTAAIIDKLVRAKTSLDYGDHF